MAKKITKSLKERIDALINALGAAEKPSSVQIRNELVSLSLDVEKLEDGEALAQKDARISDLETALERSDVELGNLKILLEEAGEELEAFREEQKKREEEEADLPEVQFNILDRLPSKQSGVPWTLSEIAYIARIPIDEAEIHIDRLGRAGLIKQDLTSSGEAIWHRTIPGSEFVLAKRLANEDQPGPENTYEYADLRKNLEEALYLIRRNREGIDDIEVQLRCGLGPLDIPTLAQESFITSESRGSSLIGGRVLLLTLKGMKYLGERGLF